MTVPAHERMDLFRHPGRWQFKPVHSTIASALNGLRVHADEDRFDAVSDIR